MKKLFLIISGYLFFAEINAQQLNHPVGLSANSNSLVGRLDRYGRPAPDSRAWTDPALQHNRLLQEKLGDGYLIQVGNFRVKGTPFLYGEKLKGNVFSEKEKAWNIYISFNTNTQELEFYSTSNPDKPLVKEPGSLDSFIIQSTPDLMISENLKFVYGPLIGSNDKNYYQEICGDGGFVFYKRYRSEVVIVSDNYAQQDLREFELEYEYFYYNKNNGKLKKLKKNPEAIVKEFKGQADLENILTTETFYANQEEAICNALQVLNKPKKGF
jgi:hypothetical protein